MLNILLYLKNIFIPSFSYCFNINSSNLLLTAELKKRLDSVGATNIENITNGFRFKVKTSDLLKKFCFGQTVVTINHKETNKVIIKVKFHTQKIIFLTLATILSLSILFNILTTKEERLLKISIIPISFIFGHIVFWGYIPANAKRIKKFFWELTLEDEK